MNNSGSNLNIFLNIRNQVFIPVIQQVFLLIVRDMIVRYYILGNWLGRKPRGRVAVILFLTRLSYLTINLSSESGNNVEKY